MNWIEYTYLFNSNHLIKGSIQFNSSRAEYILNIFKYFTRDYKGLSYTYYRLASKPFKG